MPNVNQEMTHNGLIARQLARKSCRNFMPGAIDPAIIELMIAGAQCSPTSGMLQTYGVLALTTKEEKEKLFLHEANKEVIGGVDSHNLRVYYECPIFLIWIADLHRIEVLLREALAVELHDPDCIGLLDSTEINLKSIIDTAIVAQSFAMIAESYGYGTMYMGAIRQINPRHFQEQYNMPHHCVPIFGMAVGVPDISRDAWAISKPRMPTASILHFGNYKPITGKDELGGYNEWHGGRQKRVTYRSGDKFTFVERLVERFNISTSKSRVGDFFKSMGFWFK
jgi:nitroreductase